MSAIGKLSLAGLAYQQFPFLAKKIERQIGDLIPHVVIREEHRDELEITDHPVQTGTPISDHSFKKPKEVTIECGWSDSPVSSDLVGAAVNMAGSVKNIASSIMGESPSQSKAMYLMLVGLQENRTLVNVTTGKRIYKNMLIKSLAQTTDAESNNIVRVTVVLREVILVGTQTAIISQNSDNHASPAQTTPPINQGVKSLTSGAGYISK